MWTFSLEFPPPHTCGACYSTQSPHPAYVWGVLQHPVPPPRIRVGRATAPSPPAYVWGMLQHPVPPPRICVGRATAPSPPTPHTCGACYSTQSPPHTCGACYSTQYPHPAYVWGVLQHPVPPPTCRLGS